MGPLTIEVDGLPVAGTEVGSGEPVVLLLHGFGTDRSSWDDVIHQLTPLGRVVAIDRPGSGETPLGTDCRRRVELCTVDGEAALIGRIISRLGVAGATLVGHSAGALVAAAVALREPRIVHALVLESPAIDDDLGPPPIVRRFARTGPGLVFGPPMLRVAWPLAVRAGVRRSYADPIAAGAASARVRRSLARPGWADDLWARTRHWEPAGVARRLDELDHPTLVVAGPDDRIVSPARARAVAARIRGAELVTVAGTGHVPHEERPEEFADLVLTHVRAR